ncbi:phage tail protein [Blautia wexlerae]|uniref:phage tail protein n=1 Tax=Blautia wexlerae TaxID=418240 RepID=UPI0034A44398
MIYKIKLDGKVLYYPGDRQAAVINPELDLQTGYAGELTLKVPPLNPLYGEIHNRKSMVSVYRGNTEIFYGEVRTREKDRFKNQPVKATGALSFLADSILPQQEWHDISPRDLLDAWLQLHNNQVEDRKKIYTGVVTIHDSNDSLYRITDRENTLEAIRDKLVDRLGGYLRLRHENDKLYLDWLTIQEYGKYCEQPIQFGENLMDYSETMTADDVITALIPLGAAIEQETDENASEFERLEKNVDITSVNDGKDYIYSKEAVENFGWVWRTEKWDDVSVPANLLKKATEFLTSNQYESLVISLTAVDLSLFGQDYDSFDIGDRVLCNAIPYGMKKVLPVMEMKIPLQQPDQAQLTLGENLQQSFTDQTSGTFTQIRQEATDAGRVQTEWMKSAIDNLTKQMTGAKGGYKLTEFDENGLWLRDLYMDAPDKNQATNILQINKNGIGGSHNGYAGPYTVGMTLDGTILGERILAGSIKTEALSTECKNYIETKISDGDSENKKAILKEVTTSIEAMDGKITLSVSSLEQQLERKSGNWYGNYEPTSGNNPASAWTTDELRQEHERDLFFNTTTGYAYQYQKNDSNEYGWVRVKDKDIEAAQSTAESALSKIEVQEGLITAEVSRAKGEEEKLRSAITLTETNILSTVSKTYTTQEMANKLYANAVQEGQDAADQAEKNAKDDTDTKLKNYSTTVEMNSAINQAADSISLEVSKKYATTGQLEEKYTDAVKAGKTAADLAESNATKAGQTAAANAEANATKAGQDAADQAEKNAKADTDTKLLNYSTTLEMNSAIKQAADSISLEVSKTYTTTVQVEEKYKDAVKAGQTAAANAETNATKAGQTAADQAEKNAKADTDTKLKSYSTTEQMNTAIKLAVDNITLEVKTVRQAVSEKNGNFYGSKIPTTSNEPASAWTTDDLKSLHVGDIYYDITTGYAYRYTYKTPGLKITFSSDSRTESVNYDYVKIYYNDNGTMKLAGKFGGTDIAGASVFVPTSEFYVYWRTDSSNCNFYGFSIASVTSTSGEGTGTAESLPNYTVTELSKGTYPESPNHGNYGNNINLLWKCSGTTSGSKTASWERIQDQDISVAKAQADAAKSTADAAKDTADTAKDTADTAISRITVAEDSITSEVSRAKNAESGLSSRITQTETSISSKVSKGDIASSINQTAQSVKINASKINFNGLVTANTYFEINTDGSFAAKKGTIGNFTVTSGKITTGYATLSMRSHAFIFNGGLEIHTGTSTFSDGSDAFKVFNLSHVTSGGHMVFASDGATVAYLSSSSKRYKDHIASMTLDEAKRMLNVPVIWFKYKENYLSPEDWLNGKKMPGFYAEDIYSIFPEAAQLNEKGEPEDWNFRVLIPVMLKLIQNLYEEKEKTA